MKREGRIPGEEQTKHKKAGSYDYSTVNSHGYLHRLVGSSFLEVNSRGAGASENIMRLEYDHHFELTTGGCFHADHPNLCIGLVQITTGESSEIFCSCLVGGRDPVNKRVREGSMNKARCIVLRNVAEGVTFYIDLRRKVFDTYLGNMNRYPLARWGVPVPGYLGRVLHRGIYMLGSNARVSLIKKRFGSRY